MNTNQHIANKHLCAVYLNGNSAEWHEHVADYLRRQGYNCIPTGSSLKVWLDLSVKQKAWIRYVEGWIISSHYIGSGRRALAILNRRFYFDSSYEIDERQEHLILEGQKRPSMSKSWVVAETYRLCSVLENVAEVSTGTMVELEEMQPRLSTGVDSYIGEFRLPHGMRQSEAYSAHGFDQVPTGLEVVVISSEVHRGDAQNRFRQKLTEVALSFHLNLKVHLTSTRKIHDRINQIASDNSSFDKRLVLLFLMACKQQDMHPEEMDLLRKLDELGIAYRRAYLDDDHKWSIRDQLGSLIQAAGGLPHRVKVFDLHLPWSVGIDLSHPLDSVNSNLCVTLVNPSGQLIQAWTRTQYRNEEVDNAVMSMMLKQASELLKTLESASTSVLVIRDGKIMHKEDHNVYLEAFQGSVTLLEVLKRKNPLIINNQSLRSIDEPAYFIPTAARTGEHSGYIITHTETRDGGFPTTVKLRWRDEWDRMRLGTAFLPKIYYALTLTPGLGMHRRYLPAPLYWADGIAAASDKDLRFRGQPVIRMNPNSFS